MRNRELSNDHEHIYVEEQEPSGRLVLPPCLICGLTAMDAMNTVREHLVEQGDYVAMLEINVRDLEQKLRAGPNGRD